MSSWQDMASENETAARHLQRSGFPRSAASRAYYAVYAGVADRLAAAGQVGFGTDERAGPSHASLPVLCENNVPGLKSWERRDLKACARRLYRRRIEADYLPATDIGNVTVRECLTSMAYALKILRVGAAE